MRGTVINLLISGIVFLGGGLISNATSFKLVTSSILVVIVAVFAFLVMSIIGIVLGRRFKSRRQRSSTSEN